MDCWHRQSHQFTKFVRARGKRPEASTTADDVYALGMLFQEPENIINKETVEMQHEETDTRILTLLKFVLSEKKCVIITGIRGTVNDDSDGDSEEVSAVPAVAEVLDAIDVLRRYAASHENRKVR